jgi:hypothetical protein
MRNDFTVGAFQLNNSLIVCLSISFRASFFIMTMKQYEFKNTWSFLNIQTEENNVKNKNKKQK